MTDTLQNKMEAIELDVKKKKNQLNRLEKEAVRQHKGRTQMKRTLQEIKEDLPNNATKLRKFTITLFGAAASDRRRSEGLLSSRSLGR